EEGPAPQPVRLGGQPPAERVAGGQHLVDVEARRYLGEAKPAEGDRDEGDREAREEDTAPPPERCPPERCQALFQGARHLSAARLGGRVVARKSLLRRHFMTSVRGARKGAGKVPGTFPEVPGTFPGPLNR